VTVVVRDATPGELADWDRRTVEGAAGHVYQSRAWAEHRATTGWRPRYLIADEAHPALVLSRPWVLIGGAGAYIPRGPVTSGALGDDGEPAAARLVAIARWLGGQGVDVVSSDAEIPAATGYGPALRSAGFRPIPEIQPSRHRLSLPLVPGTDDDTVFAGLSKSTRQRIEGAIAATLRVARYDLGGAPNDDGLFEAPPDPVDAALDGFYGLLESTGQRRHFRFGPRAAFVPWWTAAHARGFLVYLEARLRDAQGEDRAVAGLILYRHGRRLTTVHSADRAELRTAIPGIMHLLRWRAIQLAIREGRDEMDLGGVDVGPDHLEPSGDDPMAGLYAHKRSFGARWVEMTGAHEIVLRSWRYGAGRLTGRVAATVRR
jgi:lipid II:glycine glycyltransferase (peptidoglycan interpeptide bridge formation enzyme)